MKLAHKIVISVFCKDDEDPDQIQQALISLVGLDLEKEKLKLQQQTATSFKDKKIKIFKIELEKERHTNAFLHELIDRLTKEQRDLLLRQLESRLDEELDFYIRFDKARLLQSKELFITDRGECFHMRISVAAFPSKREKAREIIEKLLKPE